MKITIKELVRDILEVSPECRNDYKKLIWRVWTELGFVDRIFNTISYNKFMEAPPPESIRRPAQNEFRSDRLLGENKIQPNRMIRDRRQQLSKSKGVDFIQARQEYEFDPVSQNYKLI